MKYLLSKDKKKRKVVKQTELQRLVLKSILYNLNFTLNVREYICLFLTNYNINTSKTRIHNRCVITNRSRYLFTLYKISRLEFKRLAVLGFLPGIYRKTW